MTPRLRARATATLAGGVALAMVGLATWLVGETRSAFVELRAAEARYSAVAGTDASADVIAGALAMVEASLDEYSAPGEADAARLGSETQLILRSEAERAGLRPVSSEILPPRGHDLLTQTPVAIGVEGDVAQIHAFLLSLSSRSPKLLPDRLVIEAAHPETPGKAGVLVARAVFSSIRRAGRAIPE